MAREEGLKDHPMLGVQAITVTESESFPLRVDPVEPVQLL